MNFITPLQEHFAAGRLTLFLGTSLPATLTGLPGRTELAAGLAQRQGLPIGLSLAATAQRVAQGGNRFTFTDYLIRQLDTLGRAPQPIHRMIVKLPWTSIVTTAYDNLLELAFQEAGVAVNRVVRDSDLAFVDPRRPVLIKLYGDLQQRDTLIVTEDDQYGLWRSREKEGLLDEVRRAMRGNAVLFLGHSLTDPDFHLLWREVLDRMGRFALGAYAVCSGMNSDEQRVWEDRLVRVVDLAPVELLATLTDTLVPSVPTTHLTPPVSLQPDPIVRSPSESLTRTTADLDIWLRRRLGAPHEALVTFRPPGNSVDEHLIEGLPPSITLDPLQLLPHTLNIEAYGDALSQALFADSRLALALIRAQERARGAGVPLRLRFQLDADDPALHGVRWELLRDPQRGQFICVRDEVCFSRYIGSADATPIRSKALAPPTALVALSNPVDLHHYGFAPLEAEVLLSQAQAALAGYAVEVLPHTTLPILADRLRAGPTVLHLIAHGQLLNDGSTCLYLERPEGKAAPVSADRLAITIAGLAVRPNLVVLAACQTAGPSDQLGSGLIALGPQLAQAGVGAVLAMHDQVAVSTVAAGMPILFDELRQHGNIDRGVAVMRNVLATRGDDWWQPVLYLRLRDGQLWPVN